MDTNFSIHAFSRVTERLAITHGELATLLDSHLYINIGEEKGNNRVHKLFYSKKNNICFVAIQDIKSSTVITVLPIDYHENIAWNVSIESQSQAKKLIVRDSKSQLKSDETTNSNAIVFKITGSIVTKYGEYLKIINLGSWSCEPYDHSIDLLIEDSEFIDGLTKMIEDKLLKIDTTKVSIQTISIKLGKKSKPITFSASELVPSNDN